MILKINSLIRQSQILVSNRCMFIRYTHLSSANWKLEYTNRRLYNHIHSNTRRIFCICVRSRSREREYKSETEQKWRVENIANTQIGNAFFPISCCLLLCCCYSVSTVRHWLNAWYEQSKLNNNSSVLFALNVWMKTVLLQLPNGVYYNTQ